MEFSDKEETIPQFFSAIYCDQLAKIRQHNRKESLKISKITKFESDLLKTEKDITPQSRRDFFCKRWYEGD